MTEQEQALDELRMAMRAAMTIPHGNSFAFDGERRLIRLTIKNAIMEAEYAIGSLMAEHEQLKEAIRDAFERWDDNECIDDNCYDLWKTLLDKATN